RSQCLALPWRCPHLPVPCGCALKLAPFSATVAHLQRHAPAGRTRHASRAYLEVYIHSEIYRARPDVHSVVHSHAPLVVPYSIVDEPLKCVSHMAGFLAAGGPKFEIRDEFRSEEHTSELQSRG